MVQAHHLESQLEALMATEALRVYLKHQIESSNFIVSDSDALKIHFRLVGGGICGVSAPEILIDTLFSQARPQTLSKPCRSCAVLLPSWTLVWQVARSVVAKVRVRIYHVQRGHEERGQSRAERVADCGSYCLGIGRLVWFI